MRTIKYFFVIVFLLSFQFVYAQKNQSLDYNLRKAYELLEKNDKKEAMKYINQQIEETPKSADAYVIRARVYREDKKFGNALSDINKAISLWKKDGAFEKYTIYWWRADIYSNMEMYKKALSDYGVVYKEVLKKGDLDLIHEVLYQRAQVYYELQDYDSADADYYLMLKHNEADQVAMIGLVRNMLIRENYDGAISMANECEKYDAGYSEIYRFRMQAYDKKGELDKAIDDAVKYFELSDNPESGLMNPIFKKHLSYALALVNSKINNDSEDNRSWKVLRVSLYELGYDYARAIEGYNALEEEYGASRTIHYYRSKCYHELGDSEKAISDISKGIEMGDGKDYYSLAERADFYRESGKYEQAIEDFTKMIELVPMDAYAYYKRGWCYELLDDDNSAMKDYNAGIDVDKEYPYIFLMRGELYRKRGNEELAIADFEEVIRQDTLAKGGSCRHYALFFLNRNEEAIEWMNKIVASDPENNGVHYDKSCLYARMNKIDEAIIALKTALEKGYRSFAHIEHDDDMDALRSHPDFIAMIDEYRVKHIQAIADNTGENSDEISVISEIQMKKMYSGVYEVPCTINNLPLKFIFDTGASDVSISSVEASFMLKNGYLSENDIRGKEYFSTATGEIHEGTKIRLKEIKIGGAVLKNVEASVVNNQQAPLLLGQTVLERFGTITIDNINSKLLIKQ